MTTPAAYLRAFAGLQQSTYMVGATTAIGESTPLERMLLQDSGISATSNIQSMNVLIDEPGSQAITSKSWALVAGQHLDLSLELQIVGVQGTTQISWNSKYAVVFDYTAGTIRYMYNGVEVYSAAYPSISLTGGTWRKVWVYWRNGTLKVYVGGSAVLTYTDTDPQRLAQQYEAATSLGIVVSGLATVSARQILAKAAVGSVDAGQVRCQDLVTKQLNATSVTVNNTTIISSDGTIDWSKVQGRPSTFTPQQHTHLKAQITDFPSTWDWGSLTNVPPTFQPSYHTHTQGQLPQTLFYKDINNTLALGTQLLYATTPTPTVLVDADGKIPYAALKGMPVAAAADWITLLNKPATFAPATHTHVKADITDLGTISQDWTAITNKPAFTVSGTDILTSSYLNVQNKARFGQGIGVEGQNAGQLGGIHMGGLANNTWGTYLQTPGGTRQFNNTSACQPLWGTATGYFMRNRCYKDPNEGFIWENDADECLMSLKGSSGDLQVKGTITSANVTNQGTGTFNQMRINNTNYIEFGYGTAGKEVNAGKMGYLTFGAGLDIVGAGGDPRIVSIWDRLLVQKELYISNTAKIYQSGDVDLRRGYFTNGIVVQNENVNGGGDGGIRLWDRNNNGWGIYMSQAGSGRAMNGGYANAARNGGESHQIRFRCGSDWSNGFIWERASDNYVLAQLAGSDATFRCNSLAITSGIYGERCYCTGMLFAGSCNVSGAGVGELQGSYIGWNRSGGSGETNFMNNRGGGVGGFWWENFNNNGSYNSRLMQLDQNGALFIRSTIYQNQNLQDRKFKEDIVPMESITARVEAVRAVRFKWKDDMGNGTLEGKQDFGVIAQEFKEVFPELVEEVSPCMGSEEIADPCLVVRYEKLIIYLLKALQETNARVAALEAQ